jgi:predicted nucleic acid-binding protein
LKKILSLHGLVSIDKTIIEMSLESVFGDFEDAVQYYCAKKIGADLILTSNEKDFIHSDIKVMTPVAFFSEYIQGTD